MNGSNYKSTDLGVGLMSDRDLENIALNKAGIIGSIEGKNLHPKTIPYRKDWRFVWTITQSTGKKGTLILKPCSNKAYEISYNGIVKYLEDHFLLRHTLAVSLADEARKTKYGLEPAVLECVIKTHNDPCWRTYPSMGKGVNYWRLDVKCLNDFAHLTVPRLESVYILVKKYRSVLKDAMLFWD